MTVADKESRFDDADLSQKFSTTGKETGNGTFGEGTVTALNGQYHLRGASEYGYNFGTYIETVYVGYHDPLPLETGEKFDVSGLDFRLSDDELHLRTPPE